MIQKPDLGSTPETPVVAQPVQPHPDTHAAAKLNVVLAAAPHLINHPDLAHAASLADDPVDAAHGITGLAVMSHAVNHVADWAHHKAEQFKDANPGYGELTPRTQNDPPTPEGVGPATVTGAAGGGFWSWLHPIENAFKDYGTELGTPFVGETEGIGKLIGNWFVHPETIPLMSQLNDGINNASYKPFGTMGPLAPAINTVLTTNPLTNPGKEFNSVSQELTTPLASALHSVLKVPDTFQNIGRMLAYAAKTGDTQKLGALTFDVGLGAAIGVLTKNADALGTLTADASSLDGAITDIANSSGNVVKTAAEESGVATPKAGKADTSIEQPDYHAQAIQRWSAIKNTVVAAKNQVLAELDINKASGLRRYAGSIDTEALTEQLVNRFNQLIVDKSAVGDLSQGLQNVIQDEMKTTAENMATLKDSISNITTRTALAMQNPALKNLFKVVGLPLRVLHLATSRIGLGISVGGGGLIKEQYPELWAKMQKELTIGQMASQALGLGKNSFLSGGLDFMISLIEPQFLMGRALATGDKLATTAADLDKAWSSSPRYNAALTLMKNKSSVELQRLFKTLTPEMANYVAKNNASTVEIHQAFKDMLDAHGLTNGFRIPRVGLYGALKASKLSDNAAADFFSRLFVQMPVTFTKEGVISASVFNPDDTQLVNGLGAMFRGLGFSNNATNLALDDIVASLASGSRRQLESALKNSLARGLMDLTDQELHSSLKTDGGPISWLESGRQSQKLIDAEIAIQVRVATLKGNMRSVEGDVAMFGPKRLEADQPGFKAAQAEIQKMQKELDGLLNGTIDAPPVEGSPDLSIMDEKQTQRLQALINDRNKIVDNINKLTNGKLFSKEMQATFDEISKGTRLFTAAEREEVNAALSFIEDALGPYRDRYEKTRKEILDFVDKSVGGVGGGTGEASFGSGVDGKETGVSADGNTKSAIWFNTTGDIKFINYRDFQQEIRSLVEDTITGLRKDRSELVDKANNNVNLIISRLKEDQTNPLLRVELREARSELMKAQERQWDIGTRAKAATALRFFHATDGLNHFVNDKFFKPLALMTPGWAIRVSISELGLNVSRLGPINLIAGYSSASIVRNIRSSILISSAIEDKEKSAELYFLNSQLDKLRNASVVLTDTEQKRMEELKSSITHLTSKPNRADIEEQLWRVLDDEFRSSELAQKIKQREQEAAHSSEIIYKTNSAAEKELIARRASFKRRLPDIMESNRSVALNSLDSGYDFVPHPPKAVRRVDTFGQVRYTRGGGEWDWWEYIGTQERNRLIKNGWVAREYSRYAPIDEVFNRNESDQIDKWLQATRNHDIAQYIMNTGKLPLNSAGDIMPAYGKDFLPFVLSNADTSYGSADINENYDIRNLFGKRKEAIANIKNERTNSDLQEYATDWAASINRELDGVAAQPWRMDFDTWIGRISDLEPQVQRINVDLAERKKLDEWADLTAEETKIIAEYRGLYPDTIPSYKGDASSPLLERPFEQWDETYNAMIGAARLSGEDTLPYYVDRTGPDASPVWTGSQIKQDQLNLMTTAGVEKILSEHGYQGVRQSILRNVALFVRGVIIGLNMNVLDALGKEEFIKTATLFGFEHDGWLPDAVNSSHHYLAESELDASQKGYTFKDRKIGKGQKFKRVKFGNEFGPVGFGQTGFHEAWKYQAHTISGDEVFGRKLARAYGDLSKEYFDGAMPKADADMQEFRVRAEQLARNILDNTPKNLLSEMDLSRNIGYGNQTGTDPLDNFAKEAITTLEGVVRGMGKSGDGLDGILHPKLLDDIAKQTVPSDLKNFINEYGYDTRGSRKLWNRVDVSASHNGRLPDISKLQAIQRASNVLHEKALGPIVNYMVRQPVFILEYMQARQALEARVEQGLMTADQIDLVAKQEATINMVRYIHNPLDKMKFEENMRVVSPFYFAQNQAFRRAGRLFASNPGAFMQYVAMELAVTKWLHQISSNTGLALITMPFGAFGFGIPGVSGLPVTGGISSIASINPFSNVTGLDGNAPVGGAFGLSNLVTSMFGTFKPSFGPVMTIPMYFATHTLGLTPQNIDNVLNVFGVHNEQAGYDINRWIQNQALGPIASQTPFWQQFVPNTIVREIIQGAAFRFGIDKFGLDTQLIQAQNEAFSYLIGQRAHAYLVKLMKEDPNWHEPSHWAAIEKAVVFRESQWADPDYSINSQMWSEAHTMALETWVKKSILGFASPLSTGIGKANAGAYAEYQAFIKKYNTPQNPYKGQDLFMYEHPDEIAYITGQSHSKFGNYVPETASVLQAIDNNTALVQQHPLAAWAYVGGIDTSGKFNEGAAQALVANGVRERSLPADFNKSLQNTLGNLWYFESFKPKLDQYLAQGVNKSQLYSWEKTAVQQYGAQDNPEWYKNFSSYSSSTTAMRSWNQLDLMSQQPQFNTGKYKAVSDGVKWFKQQVLPELTQALNAASTNTPGYTYAAVKDWWKTTAIPQIIQLHPELKSAALSIFVNMG